MLWLVVFALGAAFFLVAGLVFWPPLLLLGYTCLAGLVVTGLVYAWGLLTGHWDQRPIELP